MNNLELVIYEHPSLVIKLDEKCWACDGEGKPKFMYSDWVLPNGDCEVCNGTGYKLTDNGETVLEFIKRHIKE